MTGIVLPPRRPGAAASPELRARRERSAQMAADPRPSGIDVRFAEVAAVACAVCTPAAPRGRIVHFHGGGYRMGSAAAWAPFGARLADATGLSVHLPDYALAPEHPFPAALCDALAVVQALSAAASEPLILSGDSAGGGLALSCALLARAAGIEVAGLVLLSPWLDLTAAAASYQSCADSDALFSRAAATEAADLYLQGAPATDPLASPLFADLTQAPPILVMVSSAEVLVQDSVALAARIAARGGAVQLHVVPGEPHVWPVLRPEAPASRQALAWTADFAARCLAHRRLV